MLRSTAERSFQMLPSENTDPLDLWCGASMWYAAASVDGAVLDGLRTLSPPQDGKWYMPVTWSKGFWVRGARECLRHTTQFQWGWKSPLVFGVESSLQWRLSASDLDHSLLCFSGFCQDLFFGLRTEKDNVPYLPACFCHSWLFLCRERLDLRKALVRTSPWVATSWTLTAFAFHQVFRNPFMSSSVAWCGHDVGV